MTTYQGPEAVERIVNTVTLTDENLTTIMELDCFGMKSIGFSVKPTGNAFVAFQIQLRVHALAGYNTLFSTTADFTSNVDGILIGSFSDGAANDDLTVLANGELGGFIIYPEGMESMRVRATRAAGANATVETWAALSLAR